MADTKQGYLACLTTQPVAASAGGEEFERFWSLYQQQSPEQQQRVWSVMMRMANRALMERRQPSFLKA